MEENMLVRKNLLLALCLFAMAAVVFTGCPDSRSDEDPLINPNLDAKIDNDDDDDDDETGDSGPGILTINPISVNVPVSESMVFTAAGGAPPYVFSFTDGAANATWDAPSSTWTHTPTGSTLTDSGAFVAGPAVGTNQITVTDMDLTTSESTVNLISPSSTSYRIVSTNLTPYASSITVPPSTMVYFVIQNGTDPDSFNITNNSGGSPQGYMMGARTGCWETGPLGDDLGGIYDILQVYDSSSPINVSSLRIYVSNTALDITPKVFVAPAGTPVALTANPTGVGTLSWTIVLPNQSNGVVVSAGVTATYTAGSTTNGVFGAKDIIEVRDQFPFVPQVAQSQANVPGLSVFPRRDVVVPSGSVPLTALGGSGAYTWTNTTPSLVSISSSGASCTVNALSSEGEAVINLSDGTTGGSINISVVVCGAVTTHSFTPPTSYYPSSGTMGSGHFVPLDMVVDDFDENGVPDVAMAMSSSSTSPAPYGDYNGNQVSLLLGGATDGSFQQTAVNFQLSTTGAAAPWGITSGDYNGDGHKDVAVACSGFVIVLTGDGTGNFPNNSTFPYIVVNLGGGFRGTDIVTYNFDRSNGEDLCVCDGAGGNVAVLLSQGTANAFTLQTTLTLDDPVTTDAYSPACYGVSVGNFDNDTGGTAPIPLAGNGPNGVGYVDIAVTDYYYDRVAIFAGTGLTSWSSTCVSFSVDPNVAYPSICNQKPVGLTAGDIDGDGDLDLISANNAHYFSNSPTTILEMGISVMINNSPAGILSFATAREYGPDRGLYPDYYACYFWDVVAYDFDNDGMDDIAALSRGVRIDPQANQNLRSSQVCIWRAVGAGTLNGWGRVATTNDAYATSYQLGENTYSRYFYGGAFAPIDFAGHTRGNGGAPLQDIVAASGCPYNWLGFFGKMTLIMNSSD
jgi:hypothetical protein